MAYLNAFLYLKKNIPYSHLKCQKASIQDQCCYIKQMASLLFFRMAKQMSWNIHKLGVEVKASHGCILAPIQDIYVFIINSVCIPPQPQRLQVAHNMGILPPNMLASFSHND